MRKSVLFILAVLLFLAACSPKEESDTNVIILSEANKGEYTYVIPFTASDTRSYHGTYQSRYDMVEIGVGLEEYSKGYFPVNSFYAQEGQLIKRSMLLNLVGRESDTNTQGLNPSKGTPFLTGNGNEMIIDPVIVTDVFELNFIKKNNPNLSIDGVTLAIIVNKNQTITTDGVTRSYTLSDDRLWEYATNAGRKLESYLRSLEGLADIPLCILIYNTASSDATLPGGYIARGYFTGRTGQFSKLDEKWVLMPTTEAGRIDGDTNSKLLNMRQAIVDFLPESVNVMGQAKYIDGQASVLKISVRVQGKTYAEIRALTQYCGQLIRSFNKDIKIIVTISANDQVVAIIEKNHETNEIVTSYLN